MPEIKLKLYLSVILFDDKFTDISQYFPLVPPSQNVETRGQGDHTVGSPGPLPGARQAVPGGGPRRVETDQHVG